MARSGVKAAANLVCVTRELLIRWLDLIMDLYQAVFLMSTEKNKAEFGFSKHLSAP